MMKARLKVANSAGAVEAKKFTPSMESAAPTGQGGVTEAFYRCSDRPGGPSD